MFINLVSFCDKRAWSRSRALLDSYAIRTSERSWSTAITKQGLDELHAALRRTATRQTAVGCYLIEGRSRMRLLWVVGARGRFGADGAFPAGYTRVKRMPPPTWLRVVALLAKAGGLAHDLGKTGEAFQKMLDAAIRNERAPNPVHHSWLSMRLIQELHRGASFQDAWAPLAFDKKLKSGLETLQRLGIQNAQGAMDFMVATHHWLFGPEDNEGQVDASGHIYEKQGASPADKPDALAAFEQTAVRDYLHTLTRIEKAASERSPGFWRGCAIFARAALILADHTVSNKNYGTGPDGCATDRDLVANTQNGFLYQRLDFHVREVSRLASDLAVHMQRFAPPSIPQEARDLIMAPAAETSRFAWQNHAVTALETLREQTSAPALVFNIAGTGSGKTRANAKFACTLGGTRPRISVALNLRSLTLQTGASLRKDLGIGEEIVSTVIGDVAIRKLFEGTFEDKDGNTSVFEASGPEHDLPAWTAPLKERHPGLKTILGAPVLVSTIDYLVCAGEPGRQGRHVAALLRVMHSDLILDEIDSYDTESMVAVLRLVQTAALCGRSVVCSSATLAVPVATAVYQAYRSGGAMRATMEERPCTVPVAIIHDRLPPLVLQGNQAFDTAYRDFVHSLMALPPDIHRIPTLLTILERTERGFLHAILSGVKQMHEHHGWSFSTSGKRVSFGLVRIANIRTAITVARYLSENLPHARIAAYHANDFLIQRHLKEARLDRLLTRKFGNTHIEADAEVQHIVGHSDAKDIPFIVVATPVEEVGRDHDFDWGVIEPSSTQSLVQTSGRVNRHRLITVTAPNIGILQFNMRAIRGESAVFTRPGLEGVLDSELKYPSHDLAELIDWTRLTEIDAKLRFGEHPFARADDRILQKRLAPPLDYLCADGTEKSAWMTQGFYRRYPLRAHSNRADWYGYFDERGKFDMKSNLDLGGPTAEGRSRNVPTIAERAQNDWLVKSETELLEHCNIHGLPPEIGLSLSIPVYGDQGRSGDAIARDKSFGFTLLGHTRQGADPLR
jgi:CRISPR-associated endonuclease/helicase Cas3